MNTHKIIAHEQETSLIRKAFIGIRSIAGIFKKTKNTRIIDVAAYLELKKHCNNNSMSY